MVTKLENGDYAIENGQLKTVEYIDELVQNIVLSLTNPRGKFYPNKNFGSNIIAQTNVDNLSALTYARQALNDFNGVFVKEANIVDDLATFEITVNGEERQVKVQL